MILPRSESEKRVVNEDHPSLEESMKKIKRRFSPIQLGADSIQSS